MNGTARDILETGAAELGICLSDEEMSKFQAFSDELVKWSGKINLTAIKRDDDIAVKHFVDSLTLLKLLRPTGNLLDIGSGGGFPSIPLKIVWRDLQVVSVDSVEKKVIFQRHVARKLDLEGFVALHTKAEDLLSLYPSYFDWVVSRAFSDISSYVRIALPLVRQGGKIVAMKGRSGREEVRECTSLICELGAKVDDVLEFTLPVSGDRRSLIVLSRK